MHAGICIGPADWKGSHPALVKLIPMEGPSKDLHYKSVDMHSLFKLAR